MIHSLVMYYVTIMYFVYVKSSPLFLPVDVDECPAANINIQTEFVNGVQFFFKSDPTRSLFSLVGQG